MRFIMMVKSNEQSESGALPDEKSLTAMGNYNEELVSSGTMLAGEGLSASSQGGIRVRLARGKVTVVDGPFAETKELLAGYWLIQVKSKQEAIEWAKRVPAPHGEGQEGEIEVRQLFELDDFPPSEAIDRARELEQQLTRKP